MWYGSEEIGLEGSWAYVKGHKEELENHLLMINVDVGGPVLGTDRIAATAEEKLATYLEYFVKIHGFAAEVKQGIYSSDSIPFADSGIPGVNFTRFGNQGAAYIHNRFDTLDFLSDEALAKTTRIVLAFAQEMANAALLPVERKIPQNMVEEVENTCSRKSSPRWRTSNLPCPEIKRPAGRPRPCNGSFLCLESDGGKYDGAVGASCVLCGHGTGGYVSPGDGRVCCPSGGGPGFEGFRFKGRFCAGVRAVLPRGWALSPGPEVPAGTGWSTLAPGISGRGKR